MTQPRAFSYLRFSTPEQMKGDSFRRQTSLAEEYAGRNGLELDTCLTFRDLGVSAFRGKNAETGRLGDFLRAVDDGLVPSGSYLLVESLDRISRQAARKAFRILEDIVDRGITVVTLNDGRAYTKETLDSDPTSLLLALLTFIRANEESVTKGRRLKAAWVGKRLKAGERPMTARVPAWIVLDRTSNTFRLIPERADVVRRIFTMVADGHGLHRIAETFNREGVDTFGDNGTKRKADMWHRSYIMKIIRNPAVVGTLVPHELMHADGHKERKALEPITGYYPAVVDDDLFQRVQAMRMTKSVAPVVRTGTGVVRNLVAGLAKCPKCGSTMTRVFKGPAAKAGVPKLVCTKAKAGAGCTYHSVPLPDVEMAILGSVGALVDRVPSGEDGLEDRIEGLCDLLDELGVQIKNIVKSIAYAPSARLSAELRDLETEYEQVQTELRVAQEREHTASRETLVRRLLEFQALVDAGGTLDIGKANALLRMVFDGVVIDYEMEWLKFRWKIGGPDAHLFLPEKGE